MGSFGYALVHPSPSATPIAVVFPAGMKTPFGLPGADDLLPFAQGIKRNTEHGNPLRGVIATRTIRQNTSRRWKLIMWSDLRAGDRCRTTGFAAPLFTLPGGPPGRRGGSGSS